VASAELSELDAGRGFAPKHSTPTADSRQRYLPVAVRRVIPLCGWAPGTWSLNACNIDRRTSKEILDDLLNLSHESIGVLQLAVVSSQAETETNGYYFAANIETQAPAAVPS
jgi:hypothetical protein